jgi:hypothetical protein
LYGNSRNDAERDRFALRRGQVVERSGEFRSRSLGIESAFGHAAVHDEASGAARLAAGIGETNNPDACAG